MPRNAPRSARPLPTVLALLGFVPLALVLWWALAGPRPEPTELDWSVIGFEVREADGAPAFPVVHDPEWVRAQMAGWQADLGGRITQPLPVAEGRYTAVVRTGNATGVMPLADLAGVVEWSVDDETGTRCAFAEPVSLDRVQEAVHERNPDLELEVTGLTGRCTDDGPLAAIPLVRTHVVELSFAQRLAGQRPQSVPVPAGALLVLADGSVSHRAELGPEEGLPAYPWEVARQALVEANPANPAAETGSWADPVYPLLVAAEDRVWWVLPVAPLDGAEVTSGYLLTAADELHADSLNPVELRWLEEPHDGPAKVIAWVHELLVEDGVADDPAIRPTLPSADGTWHGRVSTADNPLRYVVEASAEGEACLLEPDGVVVSCRHNGEVSRR